MPRNREPPLRNKHPLVWAFSTSFISFSSESELPFPSRVNPEDIIIIWWHNGVFEHVRIPHFTSWLTSHNSPPQGTGLQPPPHYWRGVWTPLFSLSSQICGATWNSGIMSRSPVTWRMAFLVSRLLILLNSLNLLTLSNLTLNLLNELYPTRLFIWLVVLRIVV